MIDLINMFNKMATNKEITLITQIPDDAMVTADINMIATVVRNLLTNAVKFTSKGGTVTLEIGVVSKLFLTTKNTKKAQRTQISNVVIQIFVNFVKNLCALCGKRFRLLRDPTSTGRKFSPSTRISISDTGIGISAEQIRNLFGNNAIRHTGRMGTANESGSGLGLIVCKELLEQHESTLHVESEVGKGSKFWFEI